MFVYEKFRASLRTFIHHLKAPDLLLIYLEGLQNYLSAPSESFLWWQLVIIKVFFFEYNESLTDGLMLCT